MFIKKSAVLAAIAALTLVSGTAMAEEIHNPGGPLMVAGTAQVEPLKDKAAIGLGTTVTPGAATGADAATGNVAPGVSAHPTENAKPVQNDTDLE